MSICIDCDHFWVCKFEHVGVEKCVQFRRDVILCQDCKHQRKVWHPDKRYKAGGYWVICGCARNEDPFVAHTVDGQDGEFCSAGERKE